MCAIVTMASLPSLCWCHCQDCTGIVFPLLPLRCSPYYADLFALMSHWHHHCHCTGVDALINLACLHCCASVVAVVTLNCCPWCAGIIALIAQASLPLLCLLCAVSLQASSPLLSWHVLSHGQHCRLCHRQRQHQRNKVNDARATRVATPAQ
jgi:hypothetical protein